MRPLLLEAVISIPAPAGINFKVAHHEVYDDVTSESVIFNFPVNYYNFAKAISLFLSLSTSKFELSC